LMTESCTAKYAPAFIASILVSSKRLTDWFSDFCISRTQTLLRFWSSMWPSIINSAKVCDLPDPRPPHAPLYRLASSNGTAHSGVWICRVLPIFDNYTLNLCELQRHAISASQLMLLSFCPPHLRLTPPDCRSRVASHHLAKQGLAHLGIGFGLA